MSADFKYPEDVDFAIDGSREGVYDGVIIWVLKDGRWLNRFRGEGSRREERVNALMVEYKEGRL